jgi:peptide/nickel transport system substrate-binding protein
LAESWDYNADKTQLLIKLRPDAKSAAGNPLTADDVVWSFDREMKTSSIVTFLANSVAQFTKKNTFEAVDANTVAVNLQKPTALDMAVFTWPQWTVMDAKEVKQHITAQDPLAKDWLKTNAANFGPWKVQSFDPGQEVTYTRNPNYWDKKTVGNIDKLVFRAVPDGATRLQLLESGAVDYAEKLSFDQYQQVSNNSATTLYNCASPNRDTLMLNEKFGAFAEPTVRQAISYAVNRDALVQGVYKGFAKPAAYGISDGYWAPPADSPKFSYDPAKAKALLQQAGVTNLSFAIMASPSRPGAYAQSLAIQLQSMFTAIGVKAKIDMVPGATEFSDDFFGGKYDAVIYTEPPAVGDPFYSANLYNTTESFQNSFHYDNPEYDALAKQIQVTQPGGDRDALLEKISKVIVDTVPQVYLTDNRYLMAFGKKISGYQNAPNGAIMVYHLSKN